MPRSPLSIDSVQALAHAIFARGSPSVAEANSRFDSDLRFLNTPATLVEFAEKARDDRGGLVHLSIHYPDASAGWGLINVYLAVGDPVSMNSAVSANSEKRAFAWAATYPDLDSPSLWDWAAVARHLTGAAR